MKILFDTTKTEDDRDVMFFVSEPVEVSFWGGENGDSINFFALLVDASDPQFQLKGCTVVDAQYVPSPIAEMEYVVCGKAVKLKKVSSDAEQNTRMIYITRTGWYRATYQGSGIGTSIVSMEERKQTCGCC